MQVVGAPIGPIEAVAQRPCPPAERSTYPALRIEYRPAKRAAILVGEITPIVTSGSQLGSGKDPVQLFKSPVSSANSGNPSINSALAVPR